MSELKLRHQEWQMISSFSRMMDHAVDANFRKDPSGRLVFLPSGPKGKGYFVDSNSDEEKIRALVKMYRSATTVITFLTSPCIFVPALILDDYAGMTPREHRLAIAFGVPLFFWLVLVGLVLMLWSLYKAAIPSLTSSLGEAGPDAMGQLREISQPSRRLLLSVITAFLALIVLALFAILAQYHSRG
jgi:hypothetical protein